MNLDTLPRYEPPACKNCDAFAPECMVPIDDDGTTVGCCWVCAHVLTVHEATFRAPVEDCGCTAHEVYPPSVMEARKSRTAIAGEVGGNVSSLAVSGVLDDSARKDDPTQAKRSYPGRTHDAQRDARRDRIRAMQAASPIASSLLRLVK